VLPWDIIPTELPAGLPVDLPAQLPVAAWVVVGVVVAALVLFAAKRLRRLVLLGTVASVGLLVAWNAGFLPSLS
jgi:hypothetical protein